VSASGAKAQISKQGDLVRITLNSTKSSVIEWSVLE
jgi:hypothetical protein